LGSAVVGLGIKHFSDQSSHIKDLYKRDHENTIIIAKLQENSEMALMMIKDLKRIVSHHERKLMVKYGGNGREEDEDDSD
jgi:hypothetical protein